MDLIYFGNNLRTWGIAFISTLLFFLCLVVFFNLFLKKLKILSESTVTLVDDFIYMTLLATKQTFLLAMSIYLGTFLLNFKPEHRLFLNRSFILVALIQSIFWGSRAINLWIELYLKKRSLTDASVATSIGLIGFSAKFALFSLIFVLVIQNFGFDITALVAGLGVGGIAVALAVQNILGDLFASLTIVLDKPFVVGDFVVVGDFMGAIEHIGLKTTRIRSLSGEQLIFANGDLLQSRIRNFKRMTERRVSLNLSVIYQTPTDKLEKIPKIISEIISQTKGDVRFERAHFLKIGASSFDFEVIYWINSPDFNVYADIAQSVNLAIVKSFSEEKIELAYPSRTIIVQKQSTELLA